jgi:hypothetical protein
MPLEITVSDGRKEPTAAERSDLITRVPERKSPAGNAIKEGLLYGGAAATVGGPVVGGLVGLGRGILSYTLNKSQMEKEVKYFERLRANELDLRNELDRELEIADPDESRLLMQAKRYADKGYQMIMEGQAERGSAFVEQANAMMRGIMGADSQFRKQEEAAKNANQRQLITTAAGALRDQYMKHMENFSAIDEQTSRILELTADPEFDPNKPFNKAMLMDLISVGVNGAYKDAPDWLDAIGQGTSGLGNLGKYGGIAGDIIGGIATAVKAEDFKVSREDFNRVAMNARKIADQITNERLTTLGRQASSMDDWAKENGVIQVESSLADYISGGEKELRFTPRMQLNSPQQAQQVQSSVVPRMPTPTQRVLNGRQLGTTARPTN